MEEQGLLSTPNKQDDAAKGGRGSPPKFLDVKQSSQDAFRNTDTSLKLRVNTEKSLSNSPSMNKAVHDFKQAKLQNIELQARLIKLKKEEERTMKRIKDT